MLEFDAVLVRIGEIGKANILLYIFLGILGIPCGMQNLGMVFFGASVEYWCDVPELSHLDPKLMQEVSAIQQEDGGLSRCEIYDLDYSTISNDSLLNWNRTSILSTRNGTGSRKCDHWYFDQSEFKSTVRTRWNLVCTAYDFKALMQTVYMCGYLLGTVSFGIISDKIGRLKTLSLSLLLMILFACAAAVVSVYGEPITFTVLRFFVGMATAGLFTTTFVLIVEFQAPKWRTYTGIFYQGFFATGFLILPGFAYLLRDLLYIQLAMALPPILLLSYYWIMPESPRWLIQKGRHGEADNILKKMANMNKRPLPDDFTVKELNQSEIKPSVDEQHEATILDVLRKPRLRLRLFFCSFCWFVSGMGYYGISNSADRLGGDIFITTLISALVEYPAYIICFFVVGHPKIGRKYSMATCFFLTGVSLCACIPLLLNTDHHIGLLILANIGKLGISAAFAIVYIFTAEIFPTVVRTACVGTCSMCARIGALLESQIMLLWKVWFGTPYIVFGIMAIIGGILTLFLPESNGEVLPETIEDGEAFGTQEYRMRHQLNEMKGDDADDDPEKSAEMELLNRDTEK